MKLRSSQRFRIGRVAPGASLAVLIVATILVANPNSDAPAIKSHHEHIARTLDEFPYAMGTWVGVDVDLPTTALEILRPNGFVSRRYSRMGMPHSVTLGIVHCEDVRDMQSHYPPRCYPAGGWSEQGDQPIMVAINQEPIEMHLYRFKRLTQGGLDEYISVVSVFVAPGSGLLTEMAELEDLGAQGVHKSALGVAQIQLVFNGDPATAELQEQAEGLFKEFPSSVIASFMHNPLSINTATGSIVK